MTALLEALRRIETQRPSRAPVAESLATPPAAAQPLPSTSPPAAAAISPPVAPTEAPAAETISLTMPRRERRAAPVHGEPPLSARATIADDVAAAAAAIAHRFRSPALVALVTCGDAAADDQLIDAVGVGLETLGHATKVFHADADLAAAYSLAALEDLRAGRGYHLLHTTAEAALEQTPLLGAADGVVMLIELERTPIAEAEAVVGMLRREAVAVSGILLIS
jgi:hypothetical protein